MTGAIRPSTLNLLALAVAQADHGRDHGAPRAGTFSKRGSEDIGEFLDVRLVEREGLPHSRLSVLVHFGFAQTSHFDRRAWAGLSAAENGRHDLSRGITVIDGVPDREGIAGSLENRILHLGGKAEPGNVDLAD